MEDHMTSSDVKDTGSTSVAMVEDATRTGPDLDLQLLCDRVRVLEQTAGSAIHSDSYLKNRIRQLERSERSLLLQLYQLAAATHLPSMQHSQRLDQRLHKLKEEVRSMSQEKEQLEHIWRERLQRCQRQLKAKEEEMSRQSQYFQNFKTQLQHKLNQSQDREQSLQNRIYALEKQLLDMTVSAATGITTISAVRITAGAVTHWEEPDRLPSLRGQGEGEEEKKEERRKQWPPSVRGRERDEGKIEKEIEGGEDKSLNQNSNEARLQGFILSLQEDLRVLLEREENGMTERRGLMDQLQEAQENSHFLSCKVEEMKAEIHQLKLSESSLEEEVEELREENNRLQQSLQEAAKHTFNQSSTIPESTCLSSGASSPSCSPVACPLSSNILPNGSSGCSEKVQVMDEQKEKPHVSAVSPFDHQATAESTDNTPVDHSSSAKSDTLPKNERLNFFGNFGSKMNPSIQSLTVTTETVDEFRLGAWCYRGVLNLEESPSEECDALRDAYRSLGLEEDLDTIKEQRDRLEDALQRTQEQLQVTTQENGRLRLQIHKQHEEEEEEGKLELEITTPSTCEGDDHLHSPSTQDSAIFALAADDLVQALNQENRALAERIQELQTHIELREEEIKREQTQVKELVSRLEADRAQQEQENQEQGCLITELTRKTEDDLNTIMELQQKVVESEKHKIRSQNKELHGSQWKQHEHKKAVFSKQNNLNECADSLVTSMPQGDEKSQLEPLDDMPQTPQFVFQDSKKHCRSLQTSSQEDLHISSLTDQQDHLSRLIQSLKTEQEELTGCISCLRTEQQEVTLSVQAQTEEKQHLTRAIWGLKEEKDGISQSLAGLKQEREHLTRAVCGLKDERDNFKRSMSGLKEEKEQLFTSISDLKREKEILEESLSSGIEERDQTVQSLQNLQNDIDQLSHAVLDLKQERDELIVFLKSLNEQKVNEQSTDTLLEDRAKLIKSVSSLREEQERIELSITHLKQEEKQVMLLLQGLKEENSSLLSQTQTDERKKPHLLNINSPATTKTREAENAEPRCQNNFIQEKNDLMREIEALGTALQKSQEELEKTHGETQRLHSELGQSEAKREEAERKASQAVDKVVRLTDAANQMEETRKENESLTTQVKELQNKVTGLLKEKTDALSLKAQIEEHYNILTAQLKAKTVALEELNSEYISLKRGHGTKDDLSTVLISLRTRYNDIRAKYDALLQKKSQTDLDMAPLKAKLSCLVLKCQERNNILAQMSKVMHKHGCVDYGLKQQVDQLLRDRVLQSYTTSFTPGSIKTQNYSSGLTAGVFSKTQDYSNGLIPATQPHQSELTAECKKLRSEKCSFIVKAESTTILQDCTNEKISAAEKNAISPVPTSPVQEPASVQVSQLSTDSVSTNLTQLSSSASGLVQDTSGLHQSNTKADPSPDRTGLSEPSAFSSSPVPASSGTSISLSKRLSSPEKIISLHEQLQKTLQSSYQAPVSSGRGQQTRKSLSFSAPVDLNLASRTNRQNLSTTVPHTNTLPVTAALSQVKHTPVGTSKPVPTNKPTTLFSAVTSRSANVTFCPNNLNHLFKADVTPTASNLSSSSNSLIANAVPSKAKFTSSSGANITASPKLTNKISAITDGSDVTQTALSALPQNNTTFLSNAVSPTNSDVLIRSDTPPKTTASDMTAPSISTATKSTIFSMISKMDGAAHTHDGLVSAHRSTKPAKKSSDASEKAKSPRTKQEAPAEVRSVEVIQTVGQSSLMIGWERPPLDELGCSNGTFVYGYRLFVDGDFHKSVMSSACTKCILENVDMSVPFRISVQTLGSNGLSSNSVHTMYRTPPANGN
ncbi:golgin subfamily A member 4-like [Sphaeramia orbicularis]|uniref:golgin subfamily A member 4-like n=1 Tax=Sphaeramia orbicularis TaxID=375764 RepID=UPI00117CFCC3|nr:golgin subfamily A member 4-like [Sphaeramia orbicularis]XP_030000665.1 golgin subfamily A member 4-like [Sphaeramia orbicularis]XP_030000666.1 golgin subfamily A member 4-like [Sphaeramia orbicularis]